MENVWFLTDSSSDWRGQDSLLPIPAAMAVASVRLHLSLLPLPIQASPEGSWNSHMKVQSSTPRKDLLSCLKASFKAGMPLVKAVVPESQIQNEEKH